MNVTVRLAGGELVQLDSETQHRLYEQLWKQQTRGSIMVALSLRGALTSRNPARLIRLAEQESAAFRKALAEIKEPN